MEQISLKNELNRKILHFCLLFVPVIYMNFGKWPSLAIFFAIAAIVVPTDYLRRNNDKLNQIFVKVLGPILRQHELAGNKLCGASFVAISACITFLFFKAPIAVTAFCVLVISDGCAAIIGKSFPSQPFFEKSISGAAGFFATGLIVLIVCGNIFDVGFLFYLFAIISLFFVTIVESRPSLMKVDDNLTIPVIFALSMAAFDLIWGLV